MKSIEDSADRELEFLYEWGSMTAEKQIADIERLQEMRTEFSQVSRNEGGDHQASSPSP